MWLSKSDMTCPLAPDWLMGRARGTAKSAAQSPSVTSCQQSYCPVHKSSTYSTSNGDLNEASCISGCCCFKKHTKTTSILRKLSEQNLCNVDGYPSSNKNGSGSR